MEPILQNYHNIWVTDEEISLIKYVEGIQEERADEVRAKRVEREIMAQRSLCMQQAANTAAKVKKEPAPPPAVIPTPNPALAPAPASVVEKKADIMPEIKHEPKKMMRSERPTSPMNLPPESAALNTKTSSTATLPKNIIKKRENAVDEDDLMDIETIDPNALFSSEGTISDTPWKSSTINATSPNFLLPDFGYFNKQTLGLRLTVPNDAKSWSFNICPARDFHNNNILLHFNPRYNKKTLVMTDKQGTWGPAKQKHFSQNASSKTDGLLAKHIDLMVQIRPDGFYIFANDMFNSFFAHRRNPAAASVHADVADDPGSLTDLKLIVNATDANGKPLDLELHKVWWGRREPDLYKLPFSVQERIDKETRSEKAAQSKGIPFSQRSLLIEGLPKGQTDLVECQAVEFALTETFSEWVVEDTSVVPGEGYAFLRLSTAEAVPKAIEELDGAEIVLTEVKESEEEQGSVLKLSPMTL